MIDLIKNDNKCLNFVNNRIKENECDELIETQIFSIIFTGNKKNECRIQNYNSKKYIKYQNPNMFLKNCPIDDATETGVAGALNFKGSTNLALGV